MFLVFKMQRSTTPTNQRSNVNDAPNIKEVRQANKRFRAELIGNQNIIIGQQLINRLNEEILIASMNNLNISINRFNAT